LINLTTDEENAIRELREDNNAAAVGIYVLPSPSSGLAMFEGEYNILPGLPVAYAEHLLGAPIPIVGGPRVIRIVGIPFPQPPPFQAARGIHAEPADILAVGSSKVTTFGRR